MNVEIGAEAALFPEREYIYGIFVAVCIAFEYVNNNICDGSQFYLLLLYSSLRFASILGSASSLCDVLNSGICDVLNTKKNLRNKGAGRVKYK
jgi:hypothetical protein